ncbi:MAG TPA: alpha/beta hydrolase [Nocardioidaceae bacterium]|nr:alpha/beta hydrolase [Nocardioidaceae bacterium]
MPNLYRSSSGQRCVRDWCTQRLAAWPVPHATSTVETSLGETHLLSAGEGGTVCVYLPGTNFNAATSLGLLGHLARRCRVVAADLPGQPGLSSPTRPRPETQGYASWLAEVLTGIRAEHASGRLVVAGHSRGAAVAMSGPTDVDGLVLVSPAGLVGVRVGAGVLRTALPWMLRPTPARSRALLRLMSGQASTPAPLLAEWLTLVARESRSTGAPGPLSDDLVERWRGRPVRVLVGEHDHFFPSDRVGRAARDRLGVEAEVLPGLGHLAVEEAPEQVAEAVLAKPGDARAGRW